MDFSGNRCKKNDGNSNENDDNPDLFRRPTETDLVHGIVTKNLRKVMYVIYFRRCNFKMLNTLDTLYRSTLTLRIEIATRILK